jgi:hypothetical protein
MPTSLPLAYSADVVARDKSCDTGAVWFIAIWGIAMLTFVALSNFGADTGAMDPFQLLATF